MDAVAWHNGNSGRSTHPFGAKAPNGLGIYDMSENAGQWREDTYDDDEYGKHRKNNPLSSSGGSGKVSRGGSWTREAPWASCFFQGHWDPSSRGLGGRFGGSGLGLRLVKTN